MFLGSERGSVYSIFGYFFEGLLLIVNLMAAGGISAFIVVLLQDISTASRQKNGRKLLVFNVITCSLSVVFCAALAVTGTIAAQSFNITYGLAAGGILALVFAVGSLIQNVVLNKLDHKQEKRENQTA